MEDLNWRVGVGQSKGEGQVSLGKSGAKAAHDPSSQQEPCPGSQERPLQVYLPQVRRAELSRCGGVTSQSPLEYGGMGNPKEGKKGLQVTPCSYLPEA